MSRNKMMQMQHSCAGKEADGSFCTLRRTGVKHVPDCSPMVNFNIIIKKFNYIHNIEISI